MARILVSPVPFTSKIGIPTISRPSISFSAVESLHFRSSFSNNTFMTRSLASTKLRASVGTQEFVVEPATNVKFPTSLTVPGGFNSLTLLGTGYREKVFAIIGVKVYAAGLYLQPATVGELSAWKGKSATQIEDDGSIFNSIFEVRDVDGRTFWDALNDAISPRIKTPTPVDELALSKFRETFEGRPLKQGNVILLTWVQPSQMLVSISADGLPFNVDATIDSTNVSSSLFYVYFGEYPVSPSLKKSVASGLASLI
ncbi:fatty-acid-binding protein 3, chloroplastic isoform X2 [Nymphaea colorata]|uniref:fatty-acid-binding protein 3, chloroplastic isoform X2 n=1 Tax=Nymphaea colorata TaxID=210225 RepID=UPI00129E1C02|nr:fatty-acid-binding protein 3, chloroplastic isoform X2 [Nymphaea colorata]